MYMYLKTCLSSVFIFTVVSCGDPGLPANTDLHGTTYTYQSSVVYSCQKGYVFASNNTRTCTAGGTWSGEPPFCIS